MRALAYARYGTPDVLELTDLPLPKVPTGWVLVKVRSAAVTPVHRKTMSGSWTPSWRSGSPGCPAGTSPRSWRP